MQNISFKLGYKYLRSNKGGLFSFTSLLAVIGMMIGLASLIVVTSVMNGFEKELENRILGVIPHATISSNKPIDNFVNLVEDINLDNEIIKSSPYIEVNALISSGYNSAGTSLIGIDPLIENEMSIIPTNMLVGDISDLDEKNTIIIGSLLAANLGSYVGDTITITTSDIRSTLIGSYPRSINLKIIGIFELRTEIDQYLTLVSHSTAQKLKLLNANQTQSIRLKTIDLFNAESIANNVIEKIDINKNEYQVSSWKLTHGTLFEAIQFEKLLISLMLFLIVIVAAILVLSTVIMTVKAKEREIGILMTIGASSKQIILIFLFQGFLVSVIGMLAGLILGFILILNLNNMIVFLELMLKRNLLEAYFINYFPYYIDYPQILLICLITFVISIISSVIPSFKAVKLNPIQILRHE